MGALELRMFLIIWCQHQAFGMNVAAATFWYPPSCDCLEKPDHGNIFRENLKWVFFRAKRRLNHLNCGDTEHDHSRSQKTRIHHRIMADSISLSCFGFRSVWHCYDFMGNLNGTDVLLMWLGTSVLMLLWQVNMTAVENACFVRLLSMFESEKEVAFYRNHSKICQITCSL